MDDYLKSTKDVTVRSNHEAKQKKSDEKAKKDLGSEEINSFGA